MTEPSERLSAHQRLATGAFARWARACATHPWRVVLSWIGIIALLIVLVGTVGGSLKDEFEIPGSDTQKATDLIESEFASEQGGVLNLVFAAPEGERLDTSERQEAIEDAVAQLETDEFAPTEDEAGIESVGDPFSDETFSPTRFLRAWNFSDLPADERARYYRESPRPDGTLLREYEIFAVDREIEIAPGMFFPA